MVLSIIICSLAAFAVLMIFMSFLRSLHPVRPVCHVISLSGDAAETEQQIRSALRNQKDAVFSGKLIFVDTGLSPEAQIAAQVLLVREKAALLCSPKQVTEYVTWEIEKFGTGTD